MFRAWLLGAKQEASPLCQRLATDDTRFHAGTDRGEVEEGAEDVLGEDLEEEHDDEEEEEGKVNEEDLAFLANDDEVEYRESAGERGRSAARAPAEAPEQEVGELPEAEEEGAYNFDEDSEAGDDEDEDEDEDEVGGQGEGTGQAAAREGGEGTAEAGDRTGDAADYARAGAEEEEEEAGVDAPAAVPRRGGASRVVEDSDEDE